nr:unnamed protein product [Digitaria exilis]
MASGESSSMASKEVRGRKEGEGERGKATTSKEGRRGVQRGMREEACKESRRNYTGARTSKT